MRNDTGGDLGRIKAELSMLVGTRMKVHVNMSRGTMMDRLGVLEETHRNLFVIKVEEKRDRSRRVSYSYTDILKKNIELSDMNTDEDLFPWLPRPPDILK